MGLICGVYLKVKAAGAVVRISVFISDKSKFLALVGNEFTNVTQEKAHSREPKYKAGSDLQFLNTLGR